MFEHGLKHTLVHSGQEVFGVALSASATGLAHAGGFALHGVVAGSIATHQTRKARRREKLFAKSGGLAGFSRTKANKEVTKNWSGAVAGTGGSIGMGLGGAAVGQV